MIYIFLLVAVFYLALPLVGAFQVRTRWRVFRRWVRAANLSTRLQFQDIQSQTLDSNQTFHFFGRLEAFEGNEYLWLGDGRLSVPVHIRGGDVFFLETHDEFRLKGLSEIPPPPEPPRRVGWKDLGALSEGSQFVVWGKLVPGEGGRHQFSSTPSQPLLLLVYEGEEETALPRALWSARQPIEHWNAYTPLSLAVGFVALLVVSYLQLRVPGQRPWALIGMTFALLPSTFFLPPGILFFVGFNRLWATSRHFRSLRDLAGLPQFSHDGDLVKFQKKARNREILAHVVFFVGTMLNGLVLLLLLRIWVH